MVDKVFIIAEAGVNHNGSIEIAKKMIKVASEAGADCIKFQTFKTERLVSKNARKAVYQQNNLKNDDDSQFSMLKKLELGYEEHVELLAYSKACNISFVSTPFDLESIELLQKLGVQFWKIPSGEITNYPYLVKIASTGKPIVLSTGMCNLNEIEQALNVLYKNNCGKITLLHCNTQYPTPFEDVNLRVLLSLRTRFGIDIGYSDHTVGIEIPIAAAALGATIIEKHFTLDRNMEGPDHKASLEPYELKAMVKAIRNIEVALGSLEKKPTKSEAENINIARKSIVASCCIKKGEIFTEENITTKRPGGGTSPMLWPEVLGKYANKDYEEDELIIL